MDATLQHQSTMSVKISGVIITYNEEDFIGRCLESMKDVVDEIIIVDSYSTDKTEDISKKYNAVFIKREFEGFGNQKNFAVQQASHNYVLCLDADEALSDELRKSILKVKNNWQKDTYWVKRRSFYCGKWMNYSGKYPDKKIRLFDRRKAAWVERLVHETVQAEDPKNTETLKGDLKQIEYNSYFDHIDKINYYSTLSAQEYLKNGKKSSLVKILFRPSWAFFRAYFLQLGFLDGKQGFVVSCLTAHSAFLKYVKLYGLQNGHVIKNRK